MTQISHPHTGQPTASEALWRQMGRLFTATGVVDDVGGALEPSADGTTLTTTVAAGRGFVDGFAFDSDAAAEVAHAAAHPTEDRVDLVVLRYDPDYTGEGDGRVRLAVHEGIAGAGVPDPTQDPDGIWESVLSETTVRAGAGVVAGADVQDRRIFTWVNSGAPTEIVVLSASGTFDKADYVGVTSVRVRLVAAGAGGATANSSHGGGGGAGGFAEAVIPAHDLADSEPVTIGSGGVAGLAGGATSFGAHVAADGGAAGTGSSGGLGGEATAGDIQAAGGDGSPPGSSGSSTGAGGTGGASALGGGGRGGRSAAGSDGRAPGSGGGGAGDWSGTTRTGGTGASGIVIVEVYR